MSDTFLYSYPSPLANYKGLEALGQDKSEDGKSLVNPVASRLSPAYDAFVEPIAGDRRGGFDVHVYFHPSDAEETKFATELHERIRREFPELRIYQMFHHPIGPHPTGSFEVNIFNPHQFGAFVAWLVINRGPLSALVHPNTGDDVRDHTQRATWMGPPLPLQIGFLRRHLAEREREQQQGRVE